MDNNILAYEGHKEILKELRDKKVKCQFNQGLDIRKIDDENAKLLSELNYFGEYYFAFDDLKIEPIILGKLEIINKYITKDWKLKMFLYCNPNMDLVKDVVYRVEFCNNHKILPYLMRDQTCWDSENNEFYIDLCAWCNQPGLFKKMTFEEFMQKRTNNEDRRKSSIALYTGLCDWRCKDVRRIEDLQNRPNIPEPLICGSGHGIPHWVDRLKCCGNAVVPQMSQFIARRIKELIRNTEMR